MDYYGSHAFTLTTTENFRLEMDAALDEIGARPLTYRLVDPRRNIRRFGPTRKFRFGIYFRVGETAITVLAFAHPARKPGYWTGRAA
jgi:hypothetical protein